MQFKKVGEKYVVRVDKGEEIVSSLQQFCADQHIESAFITGIGASNKVELKFFWPSSKQYETKVFEENFEIASFSGTVSTMDGRPYLHVHVVLGNEKYDCIGGHLNAAWVSATFEAVVIPFEGKIERKMSEEIGLNLFDF
jgi:uncharacterized protein